jgi:hypothetical protein
VVLGVFALIALLAGYQWIKQRATPLPTTVSLVSLGGDVIVERSDAGADPPLGPGQTTRLQRGDAVYTGADGRAKLTFGGGETTDLAPNTHVTILDLHQSPLSRALVTILALHKGQVLTRIRHMLFQGMRFEIETRVATFQAKGTIFDCTVIDEHRVRLQVHEGVVSVAMGEQSLEVEAGQSVEAVLGERLVARPFVAGLPEMEAQPVPQATTEGPTLQPTLTELQKTLFPPAITPTRPGDQYQLYTVQPGDTLYSIARQTGVSWEAIYNANRDTLSSPEMIRVGQQLRIPKP